MFVLVERRRMGLRERRRVRGGRRKRVGGSVASKGLPTLELQVEYCITEWVGCLGAGAAERSRRLQ